MVGIILALGIPPGMILRIVGVILKFVVSPLVAICAFWVAGVVQSVISAICFARVAILVIERFPILVEGGLTIRLVYLGLRGTALWRNFFRTLVVFLAVGVFDVLISATRIVVRFACKLGTRSLVRLRVAGAYIV